MDIVINLSLLLLCILVVPYLNVGLIRKTKAIMQGRIGAPVLQPFKDMIKMLNKGQTISETTTWIFQFSTAFGMATTVMIACLVPWVSFRPSLPGDDLFVLLYMLAMVRFVTILSAMDQGSAFGGFGASREAFLSLLSEPAMFITLAALGLVAHSSNLSVIFDFEQRCSNYDAPVWLAAGVGIYLCSIVDLSRMPIDDPTTHLELTMVHEAMILENSGKNLAIVEYSHLLKMAVLFGLSVQCVLHALTFLTPYNAALFATLSIAGVLVLGIMTGVMESLSVKMQWRRTPEFIAYALTMSLFATAGALIGDLIGGANVHHHL